MNGTCEKPAVFFDNSAQSNLLLVAFGAPRPLDQEETLFDFMGVTSDIPAKRLFLGDPRQCWYHRGIPGIGDSIDSIVRHIRNICAQENIKRVVTVGSSGGGYAAILIGILINADEVVAFSPVSKLLDRTDTIFPDTLVELQNRIGKDNLYLDPYRLNQEVKPKTRINILYGANNRKDTRHAKYLGRLENVRLVGFPFFSHHLSYFLAKQGELDRLLTAVLRGSNAEVDSSIQRSKWKAWAKFVPTVFGLLTNQMMKHFKRLLKS